MPDTQKYDISLEHLETLVRAEIDETLRLIDTQQMLVESIQLRLTIGETILQVETTPKRETSLS